MGPSVGGPELHAQLWETRKQENTGTSARLSVSERALDLVVLAFLTPAILVIGLAIALAVYLDSPGPVLYRSRRVGRDGQGFSMLKFRKMRRDAQGAPLTAFADERFTPIGQFLALTRLDELPQVINVLRGEMRLVGPRPELECFVAEYPEQYREILTVTPGMTGHAQLRFLDERSLFGDDPAANYLDHLLPEKVRIDLAYARSRSVAGDLTILLQTVALPVNLTWGWLRNWLAAHVYALRALVPAIILGIALMIAFTVSSGNII